MGIWEYGDQSRDEQLIRASTEVVDCLFCGAHLDVLRSGYEPAIRGAWRIRPPEEDLNAKVCPVCGWWAVSHNYYHVMEEVYQKTSMAAAGSLRNLSLSDISTPIDEVRAYLTVKYESRFEVHPWLMEETVASVFRDFGYRARVTAYTRDGGVDVILDGPDGALVGVQVKRYRNTIGTEQIRAFAGAMLISGFTRGVFVTTSKFSRFAGRDAAVASARGYAIELLDGEGFLRALKVAQRERYVSKTDFLDSLGALPELGVVRHDTGYWRPA